MAQAGESPERELGPSCPDFGAGSLTMGWCPGWARWAEDKGQGRNVTAWLPVTSQSCSLANSREVPGGGCGGGNEQVKKCFSGAKL